VFSVAVQFIAAVDRALDGRRGKGDAVAFGLKIGRWDTEYDAVKPEVAVFPVREPLI